MVKVVGGDRPKRPPLGFSDTLWELLMASWAKERAQKRRRRPSVSTMFDRLKESVDDWEKSIVPLVPKQWEESCGYRVYPRKCASLFMALLQRRGLILQLLGWRLVVSDFNDISGHVMNRTTRPLSNAPAIPAHSM